MKKCLIFLAVFLVHTGVQAQLTKGNWLTGGSGSLYSYYRDYVTPDYSIRYKELNLDITASLGYFFVDKTVLGLRPAFSWSKGEPVSSTGGVGGMNSNMKWYSIGPFARYYFLSGQKPFNIVGDVCYLLGTNNLYSKHVTVRNFSVMAGPVIFFNSIAGMELLIGYSSKHEHSEDPYTEYRKGLKVELGFQIHLEKEE